MIGLYERILEETERIGITGKQLGELLGLKKSPLTDWKNRKSNPTLEQLSKMCEIFATSSDYLLFGEEALNQPIDERFSYLNADERDQEHRPS